MAMMGKVRRVCFREKKPVRQIVRLTSQKCERGSLRETRR